MDTNKLRDYIALKQQIASAQEALDELAAELIPLITDPVEVDGIRVTKIAPTRVVIDEPRLKKALGAAAWKRVQKTVLDRDRLETQVAEGKIDVNVVATCSEIVPNKPYLKVSIPKAGVKIFKNNILRDHLKGA